ncbi:MAG: TetR/AcrR family transcriptional regulator [Granulosicoccus sp.]
MKKVDAVAVKPRKEPRQKRSQDTVVVILEAAIELICKHGLAELTTNRIAERAGVSIGSVYQYFPGREAILARLVRDMRSEMLEDFKSAIDNQRDTTLRSAVGALVSAAL